LAYFAASRNRAVTSSDYAQFASNAPVLRSLSHEPAYMKFDRPNPTRERDPCQKLRAEFKRQPVLQPCVPLKEAWSQICQNRAQDFNFCAFSLRQPMPFHSNMRQMVIPGNKRREKPRCDLKFLQRSHVIVVKAFSPGKQFPLCLKML
jgi:hypothetical protein